jgi:hypothetical protein
MIDMRMRDHDCFDFELMALEHFRDLFDFVPGIDDDRFTRLLVAEDGAIALEEANRQDDVNHSIAARAPNFLCCSKLARGSRAEALPA